MPRLYYAYTTLTDQDGRSRPHRLYDFTAKDHQEARSRASASLREWPGCYGEVWEITETTADGTPRGQVVGRTGKTPPASWAHPYYRQKWEERERGERDD